MLANDEVLHTPEGHAPVHYPTFGDSTTPYAPPPGMTKAERAKTNWARDFYTAWGEFTTEKKFDWIEKWDLRRGEDRNVRRLMEKENKKMREEHRREYIDTVRVSCVVQLTTDFRHWSPSSRTATRDTRSI